MPTKTRSTRADGALAVAGLLLLLASLLFTGGPVAAQEGAMPKDPGADPVETNKKAAELFVQDVYNERNLDAIPLYVGADFVDNSPGAPAEALGPEFVRKQADYTLAAFPDLEFEVLRMVAEGDKVAVHWRMTGTASEVLAGPAAAGRAVEVEGISMFRYADGFIVESWDLVDRAGMMQQLGFRTLPPEAPAEGAAAEGAAEGEAPPADGEAP